MQVSAAGIAFRQLLQAQTAEHYRLIRPVHTPAAHRTAPFSVQTRREHPSKPCVPCRTACTASNTAAAAVPKWKQATVSAHQHSSGTDPCLTRAPGRVTDEHVISADRTCQALLDGEPSMLPRAALGLACSSTKQHNRHALGCSYTHPLACRSLMQH